MSREWTERWEREGRALRPDGWPVDGDVVDASGRLYCKVCHSYYCPHANPLLYQEDSITEAES